MEVFVQCVNVFITKNFLSVGATSGCAVWV